MRNGIPVLAALALALGLATPAVAGDEEAVKAVASQWAEAWNAGDMPAVGALYAEDADYINFFGESTKGRAEIEASFTEVHSTVYKGTKVSIEPTSVQFVKPDVAIFDTDWEFSDVPETEGPATPSKGQSTVVLVKQGEAWKITAHRTRIPTPAPAPAE
jgi:uncharacterized protein (TIGR02246 family)